MERVRGKTGAPPEFSREEDRLELGRAVRTPSAEVGPLAGVHVVEVHVPERVCGACRTDDARLAHLQSVEQQVGQQKRREVIVLESALEAVGGVAAATDQATRVVREHVDPGIPREKRGCESSNVVESVVVAHEGRAADGVRDTLGALGIAADDGDIPSVLCQLARRDRAEPRACSGNDNRFLLRHRWLPSEESLAQYSGSMSDGLRRIAMVSMHTSPADSPGRGDAGGMNVALLAVASQLARRGVEVDLLTRAAEAPFEREVADGVLLRGLAAGPPSPLPKNRLVEVADEFGEAVATLAGRLAPRYDLIHAHYWLSGLATLPVAIELGIPFVQSFHTLAAMKNLNLAPGDAPEQEGRLRGEAFLGSQADAVVASSAAEVMALIDELHTPAERLWVIPPGVDSELFTPGSSA